MKKLFLDDMRQVKDACYYVSNPKVYWEDGWDIVRNYGEFVEYMEFNGWYYGQTIEDFDQADVMIMSKDGLDMLPSEFRDLCVVIYLDPPRIDRLERLEYRNDINDTIVRRMKTDDEQFEGFSDYDIRIKNADF